MRHEQREFLVVLRGCVLDGGASALPSVVTVTILASIWSPSPPPPPPRCRYLDNRDWTMAYKVACLGITDRLALCPETPGYPMGVVWWGGVGWGGVGE